MSQANVEIVRRAFEAFSERDRDAWLSLCDEALEAVPSGDWPETATIRGREATWDFFLQAEEPWDTGTYQLAEMIDAGEDRVVAHQVREMRGKESGVAVRYDYWAVFRVHAGKLIRVEYFGTRGEALKAVGLSE
jgi:ketosteroid isomerase-like protein